MQPGYVNPPAITTRVYLYNRYALWLLIFYCLATLGMFLFSPQLSNLGVGIYAAILFGLPIYTGIRQKSLFFRSGPGMGGH